MPDRFQYEDETWKRCTAKADLVCSFSGRKIKQFDFYYRVSPRPATRIVMSVGHAFEAGLIS